MGKILLLLITVCFCYAQGSWQLVGFENIDIECIAQNPLDTAIILISHEDSIFRSTDNGASWSFLADFSGLMVNDLVFDHLNDDIVYAALGQGTYSDGIYRSTNGGYDWTVLEWIYIPTSIAIPGYPVGLIAVSSNGTGIFKSENSGITWEAWNDGLSDLHVHALSFCMPDDSFPFFSAGTEQGLFFRHTSPWIQATGIPTDLRISGIAYEEFGIVGFATVTGGSYSDGVYSSSDFGMNWQVVDWWIYPSCIALNPIWYSWPDTVSVLAGDSGLGIKRSRDLGMTWHELNTGLGNFYINMFSYHPVDTTRLFCATQGGLYRFVGDQAIIEREISDRDILQLPRNILCTSQPFPIICRIRKNSMLLYIIDPTGRRVQSHTITKSTTMLPGLEKSGVYFIVLQDQNYCLTRKLIIVD
jgi:hypothetical protein